MRRRIDRVVAYGTLSGLVLVASLLIDLRFRVEPRPAQRLEFFEHTITLPSGEKVLVHTEREAAESLAEWIAHHNSTLEELRSR